MTIDTIITEDAQQALITYLRRTYYTNDATLLKDGEIWHSISINWFNRSNFVKWISEQDQTMILQVPHNDNTAPFNFTLDYEIHEQLYMLLILKFPS